MSMALEDVTREAIGLPRHLGMRYGHQLKRVLVAAAGGLLVVGVALVVFLANTPYGYFDLTAMMPGHASDDTVLFRGGSVTMKTCCGDMYYGSYSRSPDGSWKWHYKHGEKDRLGPMVFAVKPGLLSIKISSTNSGGPYVLKRKLGCPSQHEDAGP